MAEAQARSRTHSERRQNETAQQHARCRWRTTEPALEQRELEQVMSASGEWQRRAEAVDARAAELAREADARMLKDAEEAQELERRAAEKMRGAAEEAEQAKKGRSKRRK